MGYLEKRKTSKCKLIVFESFVRDLEQEFYSTIKWIDTNINVKLNRLTNGKQYWKNRKVFINTMNLNRLGPNKEPRGHGGFNPMQPITYERTCKEDLSLIDEAKMDYAISILGKELCYYWYNDTKHNYSEPMRLGEDYGKREICL